MLCLQFEVVDEFDSNASENLNLEYGFIEPELSTEQLKFRYDGGKQRYGLKHLTIVPEKG